MRCTLPAREENNEVINAFLGSDKKKEESKIIETEDGKTQICGGPVKPNIVFFGESLDHDRLMGSMNLVRNYKFQDDLKIPISEDGGCDLMIVIGTALAVPPINTSVNWTEPDVPQVLINLDNTDK